MQEMFSKLSSYAALLGVIGAIGGGFMAWGEFNNRIAQLENKEFVVNETVDLSGIIKELEAIKGDIKINDAAIKFLDAKIEELKAEQDNPYYVSSNKSASSSSIGGGAVAAKESTSLTADVGSTGLRLQKVSVNSGAAAMMASSSAPAAADKKKKKKKKRKGKKGKKEREESEEEEEEEEEEEVHQTFEIMPVLDLESKEIIRFVFQSILICSIILPFLSFSLLSCILS